MHTEAPPKKTKSCDYLEQALIVLMERKPFETITIRNLVDRAGISRSAFYSQFTCKQDFIERIIERTHSAATILSTDYQSLDFFSEKSFVDYYIRFYRYVASKNRLYSVMLGKNGPPAFRHGMRQEAQKLWLDKHFMNHYLLGQSPSTPKDLEYVLAYIISAHIGLVEHWLKDNMSKTPERMANQLYKMTWRILSEYQPDKPL